MKNTILLILAAFALSSVSLVAQSPTPTPAPAVTISVQATPAPAPAPITFALNAATTQAMLAALLTGIQASLPSGTSLPAMPPTTWVRGLLAYVHLDGSSAATITFYPNAVPITTGS